MKKITQDLICTFLSINPNRTGNLYVTSVDATEDRGRLGRLLNHSRVDFNVVSKIVEIDSIPRIIFYAAKNIEENVELLYDYGDRTLKSLKLYPWLRY